MIWNHELIIGLHPEYFLCKGLTSNVCWGYQILSKSNKSDFNWSHSGAKNFENFSKQVLANQTILKKDGIFVSKIFVGSTFNEINEKFKKIFKKNKVFKPSASRKESKESFIICSVLR